MHSENQVQQYTADPGEETSQPEETVDTTIDRGEDFPIVTIAADPAVTEIATGTECVQTEPVNPVLPAVNGVLFAASLAGTLLAALIALLAMSIHYRRKLRRMRRAAKHQEAAAEPAPSEAPGWTPVLGKVHNVGARPNQQDSLGSAPTKHGVLAVVADGMGGLSDGDKVSQMVVLTMLQNAEQSDLRKGNPLYLSAGRANEAVNAFLGREKLYKSGATLIAVQAEESGFHWISIGDSRIYLLRSGGLIQINEEHIYRRTLLTQAVNRETSFADAATNPQSIRLTNFIGMGRVASISGSLNPVALMPRDQILLLTDGVFNTLSEQDIAEIVTAAKDPEQAAADLEAAVLAAHNPAQDNFTAVILGWK